MYINRRLRVLFVVLGTLVGAALTSDATATPARRTPRAPRAARVVEVPSLVPADSNVLVRMNMAEARRTPVAMPIFERFVTSARWRAFVDASGIDPALESEVVLAAARASATGDAPAWHIILTHARTNAELEQRITRVGETRGTPITWREQRGLRIGDLPLLGAGFARHVVVFTGPSQLVIVPASDLARVLDVAARHASASIADPMLTSAPDELVFVRLHPGGALRWRRSAGLRAPRRLELRVMRAASEFGVSLRLGYSNVAEAAVATQGLVALLDDAHSRSPLLRHVVPGVVCTHEADDAVATSPSLNEAQTRMLIELARIALESPTERRNRESHSDRGVEP